MSDSKTFTQNNYHKNTLTISTTKAPAANTITAHITTEPRAQASPLSSPALSRRFGKLTSVPEKDEITDKKPQVYPTRKIFRQTVKIPSMRISSAKADKTDDDTSEDSSPPAPPLVYHLSPRTLRRLEHKHQLAKMQQAIRIDLSPQTQSPPMSPQTRRRIIIKRGGHNTRRFTVARTR